MSGPFLPQGLEPRHQDSACPLLLTLPLVVAAYAQASPLTASALGSQAPANSPHCGQGSTVHWLAESWFP